MRHTVLMAIACAVAGLLADADGGTESTRPVAEPLAVRFGYSASDRLLNVNADDVGMSHAANAATIAGMGRG